MQAALIEIGVPEATRKILLKGIPRTVAVKAEEASVSGPSASAGSSRLPAGFGSRAAYRGDKLTKRVFEEILHGGYIAQEIVPAESRACRRRPSTANEGRYSRLRLSRAVFNCWWPVFIRARPPISGRRAAVLRRFSWLERVKFSAMKVFGIAGYSGSGKTTLLEKLIPQFTARGLKVSVIKHAHHGFRYRPAGQGFLPSPRSRGDAKCCSPATTAGRLMHERREEPR
jgi:hypothetical protein